MSNAVQPLKSKQDIDRMKSALSGRNLLLFIVGINSTLRISDILSLKVCDVTGEYIVLREKKTNKSKRIRINSAIKEAVETLVPDNASSDDYLFPSRKGESKAISRVQAWRILDKAAEMSGIAERTRFGTHSLRKTAAYHAYKNGTDITLLMRVLNHSSAKETLRYIGIEDEQIDEVYVDLCL